MTVYVVFGRTGEYSDRSEWAVVAYTREDDAKQHVLKATGYAEAWRTRTRQDDWVDLDWEEQQRQEKSANPMDPAFSCDYTGTDYWYEPLELKDQFTTPEPIQ